MAEIIQWPRNLWPSDRTDPQLQFATRSGGRAMNGLEQIISPLSSFWRWRAVFPIISAQQARSARIIKAQLKGRFNTLRIRVCDQYRISRREIGAFYAHALPGDSGVTYSDGAHFSDGSGFALTQPSSPIIAGAPINSTQIYVNASDFGDGMTAGVFFSINHKLYQVNDWEVSGTAYLLTISPGLREAVTSDDIADFDAEVDFYLDDDFDGRLDLQAGRFGQIELNLSEAIGRAAI